MHLRCHKTRLICLRLRRICIPLLLSCLGILYIWIDLRIDSSHQKAPIVIEEDVFISVIILTYKKVGALSRLLPSVLHQQPKRLLREIIIVDNGCMVETQKVINRVQRLSTPHSLLIHLKLCDNPGYAAGNNAAVKIVSPASKYILFLNDDVVLSRPSFAHNLAELAERQPKSGAAGCKLVDLAGKKLIEAGSMVFKDGSALGYGRGDEPDAWEYSYPRPVDYISGACLMVEREAFMGYRHIDGSYGFDGANFPNYYEDTDLQLHIQHNLKKEVWLQPNSVARHEEHGSFGADTSDLLMAQGRQVFEEKWRHELRSKHLDRNRGNPDKAVYFGADLRARNPSLANILYIDDKAPNPRAGSGYGRAFDNLSMIATLGHKVTIATLHGHGDDDWCDAECIDSILQLSVEYTEVSLTHLLENRVGYYSVVLVSRPEVLRSTFKKLSSYFKLHPFALVYDCEALSYRRNALLKKLVEEEHIFFPGWRDNIRGIAPSQELSLASLADSVISVSESEARALEEALPHHSNVYVVGHVMTADTISRSSFQNRRGVLFLAAFHNKMYYNGDAIWYYLTMVHPLVIENCLDPIPVTIAGRGIPSELRSLVGKDKSLSSLVTFVESPQSVQHLYDRSRVFIAPHLYGAGIQYKVSKALSLGLPSVVSKFTHDSFGSIPGCVGDGADELGHCIIDVHSNEEKWNTLQRQGLDFIANTHSRSTVIKSWSRIIADGLAISNRRARTLSQGVTPPSPLLRNTNASGELANFNVGVDSTQ